MRLDQHRSEFRARDVRLVAVSSDSPAKLAEGKDRFDLPFAFVSDEHGALMDRLGLRHEGAGPGGHDIFYATLLLLDRDGVVRWKHVPEDLRARATPEQVLAAVDALPAG